MKKIICVHHNATFFRNSPLFLLFIIFLPSFFSCNKECQDPAECHTYNEYSDNCDSANETNAPVIQELKSVVHSFTGSDPSLDQSELEVLDATIGGSYFVGLGEATHGTKEFFEMKDRIFRYLVENHGFRAIGFEATWGGALHVNRYVLEGIGTAKEAITKMIFWTWQTEEVVALVEWMREYNLNHADEEKLFFYGFDMQSIEEEYQLIVNYLRDKDETLKSEIDGLIAGFVNSKFNTTSYPGVSSTMQFNFKADLQKAKERFAEEEAQLVELSTQREYDLVKHAFEILLQNEDHLDRTHGNGRDYYMARNSEWIRDYIGGNAKVALWAHNGHVTRRTPFDQGFELDRVHGDDYKVLGFSFSAGSFQARRGATRILTTDNQVDEFPCTSINFMLDQVGENFFLVFDEIAANSATFDYINTPNTLTQWGALFDPDLPFSYSYPTVLTSEFDVLIHFSNTTHAKPY